MRARFFALSLGVVCFLAVGCGKDDGFEPVTIDNYPTFDKTSNEPVLLRHKLKTGQTLTMNLDLDLSMIIKQGNESLNMKMPMSMDASAAVTAVDAQGNMSVDMKITRMKVKADISGRQNASVEFDSNEPGGNPEFAPLRNMINVNMACKISPTGKTLSCDIAPIMRALDRAGNPQISKQMRDMVNQMMESTFTPLSEKPVKAGDSYDAGSLSMGGAKATGSYKVRTVSGDKSQVVLEPMVKLEFDAGAIPGADISVRKQDSGGWMLFDTQKGYATKGEMAMSMLVDIKADGEKGTMAMKMRAKITQTLK